MAPQGLGLWRNTCDRVVNGFNFTSSASAILPALLLPTPQLHSPSPLHSIHPSSATSPTPPTHTHTHISAPPPSPAAIRHDRRKGRSRAKGGRNRSKGGWPSRVQHLQGGYCVSPASPTISCPDVLTNKQRPNLYDPSLPSHLHSHAQNTNAPSES